MEPVVIKSIRVTASIAVVVVAIALVERCAVLPCQCNRQEAYIQFRTDLIIDAPSLEAARAARANIDVLTRCLALNPADAAASMLLAANLQRLGRKQEAATVYVKALQYDRRPELYLSLGIQQFELGQRDAAIENMVRARVFNRYLDGDVPLLLREEVRARANAILPDLR